MTNRHLSACDARSHEVQTLFAGIARRYDLLNDLLSAGLHRRWKRRLVAIVRQRIENSGDGKQLRTLDLCCGTGDIASALPGWVVGVDFTAAMLRIAAQRARRVRWVCADALRLPFPDGCFDFVTVGYGLRNLADLDAGLREVLRVLRTGGALFSLDFGKPRNPLWRAFYRAYLRVWSPFLGWLAAGNAAAYAYILASLDRYPGQRGVKLAMERCGFAECGFEDLCWGAMAINWGHRPR
ncbi:MAG: ubiquinone/menaquinone biosynthesis methyltransferase [Verrucomicrobiae bacterium]|nr:ubiquinone/menaquinone biosynthesis methyltransferase [Verrucomicrobiae bacterium]